MKESLVSIIMPAYNSEKFISQAIESVLRQSYNNWELIISNDCSNDRTVSIISEFMKLDDRIKLINLEQNYGAAVARNRAIEFCEGEFIAFLDSDDIWNCDKLEKQISFMLLNNYTFTCSYYGKINEENIDLKQQVQYKERADYNELLKNCPGNSTVIYSAKELGKFYVPKIKKRNDYLMWFQIINKANFIYCLKEELSYHRIVKNSLSKNKFDLIKYHWEIYYNNLNLGISKSVYYCTYWIIKGLKNAMKGKV